MQPYPNVLPLSRTHGSDRTTTGRNATGSAASPVLSCHPAFSARSAAVSAAEQSAQALPRQPAELIAAARARQPGAVVAAAQARQVSAPADSSTVAAAAAVLSQGRALVCSPRDDSAPQQGAESEPGGWVPEVRSRDGLPAVAQAAEVSSQAPALVCSARAELARAAQDDSAAPQGAGSEPGGRAQQVRVGAGSQAQAAEVSSRAPALVCSPRGDLARAAQEYSALPRGVGSVPAARPDAGCPAGWPAVGRAVPQREQPEGQRDGPQLELPLCLEAQP